MHGTPAYGEDTQPEVKMTPHKHAEARSGGHPRATLVAHMVPRRARSGLLGRPWRSSRPKGGPRGSTEPNGDVRQTLRTVCLEPEESPEP